MPLARRFLAVAVLATTAAIVAGLVFARERVEPFLPKCFFHEATGLNCPGCGGTRAVLALFHGRFAEALHDNVLVVALIPLMAWTLWRVAVLAWTGVWVPPRIRDQRLTVPIAVLIVAFFVLRNVPLWPFSLLAPLPR